MARELERQWEAALRRNATEREYEQFCAERPAKLSAAQREQVRQLARSIPELWSAPTTTPVDRQRLVRLLIERIVVEVQGHREQVKLAITWSGGFVSRHEMVRTVRLYEQLSDYPRLIGHVEGLRAEGKSMGEVASVLNAEGFNPPRRVRRASPQGW